MRNAFIDLTPGLVSVVMAEFRTLWFAELLSMCGDQVARVAPSVMVYDRTHVAR